MTSEQLRTTLDYLDDRLHQTDLANYRAGTNAQKNFLHLAATTLAYVFGMGLARDLGLYFADIGAMTLIYFLYTVAVCLYLFRYSGAPTAPGGNAAFDAALRDLPSEPADRLRQLGADQIDQSNWTALGKLRSELRKQAKHSLSVERARLDPPT